MNKNNQVNNQVDNQNHGDHCQHVQIGGQAYYDDRKYFLFSPDAPNTIQRRPFEDKKLFRKTGVGPADERRDVRLRRAAQGRGEFSQGGRESRSVLIRKLAHGRISRTQDDAVQLTLKFFRTENVIIAQAIMDEAQDAIDALLNEQLTK